MNNNQKKKIIDSVLLFGLVLFVIAAVHRFKTSNGTTNEIDAVGEADDTPCEDEIQDGNVTMYAVFGANTPNGVSWRSFDYAFQLPLTALAWNRIGFKSIVIIVGSRCEWENDPALRHILSHLETKDYVTVIFMPAPLEKRPLLSQTARIFAANLPDFPGKKNDYLITSDADLWPLHREHYVHQPGKKLVLVHGMCCGLFDFKGKKYRMYPMGNIGATVSTWREILNEKQQKFSQDADSIVKYMEQEMGSVVNQDVVVAEDTWYVDSRLVSIRIAQWMERHGNESVYHVSDDGWTRVDKARWDAAELNRTAFERRYDAHLLAFSFKPDVWARAKPLVNLMYGENSTLAKYCDEYTAKFFSNVKNYFTQG